MCRGEFSAAITQLMSKCLWSRRKCLKEYKEIVSFFSWCPVNCGYFWKKKQKKPEKKTKTKNANYALQYVRADSRCMWMKSILNLLWRRSLLQKPVHWFAEKINGLVSIRRKNLRHERVNALLLASIHWNIFLDYNKIIDIYASKYQRRMLIINPLSKN